MVVLAQTSEKVGEGNEGRRSEKEWRREGGEKLRREGRRRN